MKKIALEVKNLNIKYTTLRKFSVKKNLLKGERVKNDVFHALKDISFSLEEGKILGVIGRNGSGKSTLLKSIAGIFSPDSGEINLFGNKVSLQAIGVGFQNRLSGRENIYLSGMLLGFSKEEINEKIDSIIAFANIGDFIEKPVNTYSSGMKSKLAFSITAILETDIMLIDEILSVGDSIFRKKSYEKMKELILDDTRTVIIVSHNMENLRELCDEVLWIHEGEMVQQGSPDQVINDYLNWTNNK